MPDFPIVDTHVHLWDPALFRIPWLDNNPILEHRFGLEEFREHTEGVDVGAMVYLEVAVDPAYGLIEARTVAKMAEQEPRLQGMVAWAPLEYGDRVGIYLDALMEVGPFVRGIRRLTQGEADPAFCLRPGFIRGVKLLPRYGLTCDLCIRHHQLEPTVELVRQCPEVTFILDHIGKPDIASGQLEPWKTHMRAMAALPNVWCKVSGMVTEADMRRWQPADLAPYVQHVLEVFGEDRVAFGGDWPVVLGASSYRRWVEALDTLTADLSETARRKLWAENGRKFYRLPEFAGSL